MTAAILDHLWQSSLVAILASALTLLFRNNSAAIRYWLWFAASAKFLLPFSLLAAMGRRAFEHPVSAGSMHVLSRIQPAAAPFSAIPMTRATEHSAWPALFIAIWLLGVVWLTAVWLLRWHRLRAMALGARPLALQTDVPVRATSFLLEPGLVGIWRPVILLPEGIAHHLSRFEIDAIVTHELCHLRRRDNLLALAHMLVEAIFWFHPLVWFIGARLVAEREHACDESVLACGKNPLEYAEAILKVCRLYIRSPLPCASGVSGANLAYRIGAIMANRDIRDIDPGKVLLLAVLGVAIVMAPLATGGLKYAPAAQLARSLATALSPVARTNPEVLGEKPIASVPARARHRQHRQALAISVPPREIAPILPAIDIVTAAAAPLPQTGPADIAPQPVAYDADKMICRPPEQLPASRFLGPQVCLPRHEWDRIKKQGLELMPDGRTLTVNYENERRLRPPVCNNATVGASTALGSWSVACF